MRKAGVVFGVLLSLSWVASSFADAPDITGNWELTISTPRGERNWLAEFHQDGESLRVIREGRDGQKIKGTGTVQGDSIKWTISWETSRSNIKITYDGKIERETMKGTVQFGPRGSGEWSVRKAD